MNDPLLRRLQAKANLEMEVRTCTDGQEEGWQTRGNMYGCE